MEREYKNISGEVKELTEKGTGLAIISTMSVVDSDGDVVMPGAFGEQIVPMIPTHDWHSAPIGKASIKESGDQAIAEFKMNLETTLGREWYKSLKFDMDNPPVRQEYSYGFSVIEESRGEFEGRAVRFLKRLKVHEISPVLVGAGVGTTTLALKDKKQTTFEEDVETVRKHIKALIERVQKIKEIREGQNRPLSKERVKELIDIEGLLLDMRELLEPPNNKQSKIIAEYHELEKRVLDFRKSLL